MNSKKQKRTHKKMGFKRLLNSFKYSWDGLVYAYGNEQSLWLHAAGVFVIVLLGIIFKINFYEWMALVISMVIVLAIELLNTAIEATVDLVTHDIHPLAKIAKDCGSAAACVTGFLMACVAIYIFIPYFVALFK